MAGGGETLCVESRARQAGGLWVQGRLCAGGRKAPAWLCPCRGSSGVQNGLLVVNMLIDGHRGLAEQLVSCDLHTVLQSCWWDKQSTGCPQAMLALSTISRLAEHRLPLCLEMAGTMHPKPHCAPAPGRSGRGLPRLWGRAPHGMAPVSAWARPVCPCPGRQRGATGPGGRADTAGQPGGQQHLVQGGGGGPGAAALCRRSRPFW